MPTTSLQALMWTFSRFWTWLRYQPSTFAGFSWLDVLIGLFVLGLVTRVWSRIMKGYQAGLADDTASGYDRRRKR